MSLSCDVEEYRRDYDLKPNEIPVPFKVPLSGKKLWNTRCPFVVFHGPAGTGKTRIVLEFLHFLCLKYPGISILMGRQFRNSMTHSCMKTFNNEVLRPEEGVRFNRDKQTYFYPEVMATFGRNSGRRVRSEIVVSGLDEPKKIMSTQFDVIYINEGTDITQDQWEYLFTRNRNGVLPWQMMILDCNPQHPRHWVKQMIDRGWIGQDDVEHRVEVIQGYLTDNPRWWDEENNDWTPEGYDFVNVKLGALTGARRARLLQGKWVSAEGQIYTTFDRGVHVVSNFVPPVSWRRVWAIDWGFVNPFVWHNYAIDHDGFMTLHQEIYHTHLPINQAVTMILDATRGQPYPEVIICDHDPGDRNLFEQHSNLATSAAFKDVSSGIQNFGNRLDLVYDGKNLNMDGKDMGRPRWSCMSSTLIHPPDPELVKASKPLRTIDEFEGYVWDLKAQEKQKGDIPVKEDDHGMDTNRYAAAYEDSVAVVPSEEDLYVGLGVQYGVQISSL